MARLEERLRDLESLQHEVHEEALCLTRLVQDGLEHGGSGGARDSRDSRDSGDVEGGRTRPVSSVPEAARQLGISVSMVHKLLRERRLGHLKVGARTLITAEHVEAFLAAAEATAELTADTATHSGPAHAPTPLRPSEVQAPVHTPGQTTDQRPNQTPAQAQGQTPGQRPRKAPGGSSQTSSRAAQRVTGGAA